MNNVETLLACFASGRLVRPAAGTPNTVDLIRALAALSGAERLAAGPGAADIARRIGEAEHYVFILADGLGMMLFDALPAGGFVRSHFDGELHAVFPSTTAAALTTLATGEWPGRHGSIGWWMYLQERGLSIVSLPFIERFTERPLGDWGLRAEDVFPVPSLMPRLRRPAFTAIGADVAGSVYSTYSRGGTPHGGYSDFAGAFEKVRERVAAAREPTFTYLYLPHVDALCHEHGVGHEKVRRFLPVLDEQLARLREALPQNALIVLSADHGLVNVPPENQTVLRDADLLLGHLLAPPSGDPRTPIFHVRPGQEDAFARDFAERAGDRFLLVTPQEAEDLRLFGPEPLSPVTRRRLGAFVGIAPGPYSVEFRRSENYGKHAGLLPDEMRVPLMLA